jgi:hypothetical protein
MGRLKNNHEIWIKRLEEVKKYIDMNKKRPSESNKDTKVKKVANVEPAKINESVNNKLTEIKNFMTRISKY